MMDDDGTIICIYARKTQMFYTIQFCIENVQIRIISK